MWYAVNIFLDNTAERVGGGGPHKDAFLAAHLWFKNTGPVKGWIPVADPVTLSQSQDTVSFTMGDVYGDLDSNAVYKVLFTNPGGGQFQSPLDDEVTTQLANGTYPWNRGNGAISGLKVATPFVTTISGGLPLAQRPGRLTYEFSIEVDDEGTERYYLDPRMIVDP